jgi:hypothetical protein
LRNGVLNFRFPWCGAALAAWGGVISLVVIPLDWNNPSYSNTLIHTSDPSVGCWKAEDPDHNNYNLDKPSLLSTDDVEENFSFSFYYSLLFVDSGMDGQRSSLP